MPPIPPRRSLATPAPPPQPKLLLDWMATLPVVPSTTGGIHSLQQVTEGHLVRIAQLLLESDEAIESPQDAADLLAYEFSPLKVSWDPNNPDRVRGISCFFVENN